MEGMRATGTGVIVDCVVIPRGKRTRFMGRHGGRFKIALAAPPVNGRANEELLLFFARLLRVPQRQVQLLRGASSRVKTVEIQGVAVGQVVEALEIDEAHA